MDVRDYELDCEQIVNNANYLHYLEHTRHIFCRKVGFPFIEMHKSGIDAVVRKLEMEYFTPLTSGDSFISCLNLERKGPRFIFFQEIYKCSPNFTGPDSLLLIPQKGYGDKDNSDKGEPAKTVVNEVGSDIEETKSDFSSNLGEPVVKAVVTIVALKDGKLSKGDEIAEAFEKFLS